MSNARIKLLAPSTVLLVAVVAGCSPQVGESVPETLPDFSAARFSNPTQIDNPYFPVVPGTTNTFEGTSPEGTERIVIDVLDETREVMGITTRVVRDRAYLNDLLVEDTRDWFAQDDDGNVWYMGEEVDDYVYDDQGNLLEIRHEGVWEAGLDVSNVGLIAHPGHIMRATPMPGDVYNQEYYRGEAEDMGEVVALNVSITLSNGTTYSCLQIRDFTPLEPSANEYKYYAPGIGVIVEQAVGSEERVELIGTE